MEKVEVTVNLIQDVEEISRLREYKASKDPYYLNYDISTKRWKLTNTLKT